MPAPFPGDRKWLFTVRVVSEWPLKRWSTGYCSEKSRALCKFKVYNEQFKIHSNIPTKAGTWGDAIINQPALFVSSWEDCYVLNVVLSRVNAQRALLLSLLMAHWLKYKEFISGSVESISLMFTLGMCLENVGNLLGHTQTRRRIYWFNKHEKAGPVELPALQEKPVAPAESTWAHILTPSVVFF